MQNQLDKPIIFMCPPTNLGIETTKIANTKEQEFHGEFTNNPSIFREKAHKQWEELQTTYHSWGAEIVLVPVLEGASDQSYTADPAFTLYNPKTNILNVIKSNFANTTRNAEIESFVTKIQNLCKPGELLEGVNIEISQIHNYCEGTGDNYYDQYRDLIFSGFTQSPDPCDLKRGRSSIAAHRELEGITGMKVISVEVKSPCFHIDTCLTPLPTGHMLVYKEGMTTDSYQKLIQVAFKDFGLDPEEYLIPVSKNDAENNYVTNLLCMGNKLAIPQFGASEFEPLSSELLQKLTNIGYEIKVVDVGQFIKVGGAIHCISHLIMHRVSGGLATHNHVGFNHA